MDISKKRIIISNIMLITAAVIWGLNFVFQKIAAGEIGPFLFYSMRCLTGSITMIPIIWMVERSDAKQGIRKVKYTKESFLYLLLIAIMCGSINVGGSVMVQWGLAYTSASKASFLNAIYIIFGPIVGMLFFKYKTTVKTWIGVIMGTVGLYFLCLDESLTINKGDLIILGGAFFYAVHLHCISLFIHKVKGIHLTCLEFVWAAIMCLVCSVIFENPSVSQIQNCFVSILFAGVLGVGVCYALMVTAQKHTDPTVASLLMSLESVFGALGGVIFLNESFTGKELLGVLFIVLSIVVAQIPSRKK